MATKDLDPKFLPHLVPSPSTAFEASPADPPDDSPTVEEGRDASILRRILEDLETPVALLELSLQFVGSDTDTLPPDKRAALRDALRAGRRIRAYLDQRIVGGETGAAAVRSWRRRVDLGALLRVLADEYTPEAAKAGKAISVEVYNSGPQVRVDEIALEHVLQQAIECALAHLHGRRIHIAVSRGSTAEVSFCIEDPPLQVCGGRTRGQRAPHLLDLGRFQRELERCAPGVREMSGSLTVHESSAVRTRFVLCLPNASI